MEPKEISVSELRVRVRQVLNQVQYGQIEYIIHKFGEPAVVIINLEAYRLLQTTRCETEAEQDEGHD